MLFAPSQGIDEKKKVTFMKFSADDESDELTRLEFDWIPRPDVWEHICLVKKPERGKKFSQVKFFVNGQPSGQST